MSELDSWLAEAAGLLGLDPQAGLQHRDLVLDLTRSVAHGVSRPAAPLTAFLLGMVAGRSETTLLETKLLSGQLEASAQSWLDRCEQVGE